MKIKYRMTTEIDRSINFAGNKIISLTSGGTRKKDHIYTVINNPKTQALDTDFMWYISEKGHPVKISDKKWYTFKTATKKQIEEDENPF